MGVRSAFLFVIIGVGLVHASLPDPLSITWNSEGPFTATLSQYYGFASDNEFGYFFGKDHYDSGSQSVRLNFTDLTWSAYPDLPHSLVFPCIVPVPNGDIYIIGGALRWADGVAPNTTVYKLASGSNTYTKMASMNFGRYTHRCSYDATTNRIYAVGGSNGILGATLSSVEYYSISGNTWSLVASKDVTQNFAMINVGDGSLYTFNGFFSKDVKRYSIADNTWTLIGQMNLDSYSQATGYYAADNIIFLWGGPNADSGCEYFNLTSNTAVVFPCLDANNNSIYYYSHYGSFVAARNTFYLMVNKVIWSAKITYPAAPVPMSGPVATPESGPMSVPPGSGTSPVSGGTPTNGPSDNSTPQPSEPTTATPQSGNGPRPSQTPSSSITSSGTLAKGSITISMIGFAIFALL